MTDMELLTLARTMRSKAYAPYSGYHVGAVVKCADGRVYTGCNIENASYGACLCAERAAIAAAVCDGNTQFLKIAISGSGVGLCTPCGICRQVIFEFSPDCLVICGRENGSRSDDSVNRQNAECAEVDVHSSVLNALILPVIELLPHGFGPSALKN